MRIMGIDPGTNYMGYGVIEIVGNKPQALVMGEIDMHKIGDAHQKLRYIFERVRSLTEEFRPTEVAFESPFFGENVQSMLKLGRAQGVAIAAVLSATGLIFEGLELGPHFHIAIVMAILHIFQEVAYHRHGNHISCRICLLQALERHANHLIALDYRAAAVAGVDGGIHLKRQV